MCDELFNYVQQLNLNKNIMTLVLKEDTVQSFRQRKCYKLHLYYGNGTFENKDLFIARLADVFRQSLELILFCYEIQSERIFDTN